MGARRLANRFLRSLTEKVPRKAKKCKVPELDVVSCPRAEGRQRLKKVAVNLIVRALLRYLVGKHRFTEGSARDYACAYGTVLFPASVAEATSAAKDRARWACHCVFKFARTNPCFAGIASTQEERKVAQRLFTKAVSGCSEDVVNQSARANAIAQEIFGLKSSHYEHGRESGFVRVGL